ncbi:hypothetical protein FACS189426_21820 [Bacteroidia bacterium]|nr:hypothetical protein FACS189426_21820 [Bacteroidia bacterium]GHT84386.1 hypothetical protein FACS18947_1760 [Bacteroidia bacterium]
MHVRIGTPVGQTGTVYASAATATSAGAQRASFGPQAILKGTTRNANNTGFYKFYCIAKSTLGAVLTSEIAEVAVGCGAKNKDGEWLSFMCFNLGAVDTISIAGQKGYPIGSFTNNTTDAPGLHAYIAGEEKLYGSLFQWGRVAEGHELRSYTGTTANNIAAKGAIAVADIGNGLLCSVGGTAYPYYQVRSTSTTWYGKFIYGSADWTPVPQPTSDQLWRSGRFVQNDPCAHYRADVTKTDGTTAYQEFWHNGTNTLPDSPACVDVGTAWRTPTQDEWGELYKGGTHSGTSATATANTWTWYTAPAPNTSNRGFEIKPDGITTTMFLPAGGYRYYGNGLLYYQGSYGYYWSVSISGTNAYYLYFSSGSVSPALSSYRAYGFALRCIKNS